MRFIRDKPSIFRVTPDRWFFRLLVVLAAIFPAPGLQAQRSGAATASVSMKTFVILFRQNPHRVLTEADKQRRAEETTAWARGRNAAGHKLEPRILAPESARCQAPEAAEVPVETWPVTALLFLEARDLADATEVAAIHPALRYGASVEVRAWAPPVAVR